MEKFTSCKNDLVLEWISKDSSAAKIDDLHNAVLVHDYIIQLQISMSQAHAMEVGHSIQNLKCAA